MPHFVCLLIGNRLTHISATLWLLNVPCKMQDLSKYTVPTSFVGMCPPTAVVGMLVVSALPTKGFGVLYCCMSNSQSSTRISKFSIHFMDDAPQSYNCFTF